MRYCLKTTLVTGQQAVVKNYGDLFWDWLCDEFIDSFTARQATYAPCFIHLAARTKLDYVRVILNNVEDEYAGTDDCPFKRVGYLFMWKS